VRLTEWERDRLLIFSAAELARRHRAAGLKLNAPEAIALICDAMLQAARTGSSYREVEDAGQSAVTPADVMDGVPALIDEIRLEVLVGDGTRLVVLRNPLGSEPGIASDEVPAPSAPLREMQKLSVRNTGRRPVRVSSHYPFDQVNQRLEFDRAAARGYRLHLPAGATFRWAPGETHEVTLIRYGGEP
jgi:urease subunit gamma/beta